MTSHEARNHERLASQFRRAFVWLAAVTIAGSALELAMLRHWTSATQLIAWASLATAAAALALTVIRPTVARLQVGRFLAAAVAISSALGVIEHINSNYGSGPLDFRYADRWGTMSLMARWWAAASGAVGPSPALAPAILAQAAVFVWLAGVGRATEPTRSVPAAVTAG